MTDSVVVSEVKNHNGWLCRVESFCDESHEPFWKRFILVLRLARFNSLSFTLRCLWQCFIEGPVPPIYITSYYLPGGGYIGDPAWANKLDSMGIQPELINDRKKTANIGFCEKEQRWYGWSHRAMASFGVGDTVKAGDCAAESGWSPEYLKDHPEDDLSLPPNFTAKTLEDAKRIAIAYADSIS